MHWLILLGIAWVLLAAGLAVVVGRGVRHADRMERTRTEEVSSFSPVPDTVPAHWPAPTTSAH